MKTNNKIVRNLMKQHILNSVINCETGDYFNTFEEVKTYIQSEFNRVANYPYNLKCFPNQFNRFADYLNGAPFNFEIYYYDINEFLNSLGINPEGKAYTDEKSNTLYHKLIYKELF